MNGWKGRKANEWMNECESIGMKWIEVDRNARKRRKTNEWNVCKWTGIN